MPGEHRERSTAIDEIEDPAKIRVVIFVNGRNAHAPLNKLLADLQHQIDVLEARIDLLES